jgi:hypothetical protein
LAQRLSDGGPVEGGEEIRALPSLFPAKEIGAIANGCSSPALAKTEMVAM